MAAARKTNPVDEALKLGKGPLMAAGVFSLVSNLLYLFFPIYTQQVFSRVLMSHSTATLFVLTVGVIFVFGVSAILDGLRSKVLTNYGLVFDRYMSTPMFNALFEAAVRGNPAARSQIARDLDQFRAGISGPATSLLLDVPFIPFFFFVLFVIDPALGMLCMGGGVILFILALMQDRSTRSAITRANDESNQSYAFTESALRNSEVVRALGMTSALGLQWGKHRSVALDRQAAVSDTQNFYQNLIKLIRMIIQVMVIAAGAWLILEGSVAGGMLFANMIITARALQPIERLVGSWTVVVNAYDSYGRLKRLFSAYEEPVPATALPTPKGEVRVERLSFSPPSGPADRLVLAGVAFELEAGETLGVVGPSGAGKSTLMRMLVGVWRPSQGVVRLDGSDVYSWDRTSFGKHVGYLPQDIELFAGTVRENIGRFRPDARDEDIIQAAQVAGAHEMIIRLPKGYDTEVGESGATLSGGQRQRIGLARALFGGPSLVVLDEPNANLDAEGEAALIHALELLKARRATVVIASHRPNIFRTADKMLLLRDGRVEQFGPRNDVLARLVKPAGATAASEARAG